MFFQDLPGPVASFGATLAFRLEMGFVVRSSMKGENPGAPTQANPSDSSSFGDADAQGFGPIATETAL
jgi:hypothetical protein